MGCGCSAQPKFLNSVLVPVLPSSSPVAEPDSGDDSDQEQDGYAPSSPSGRDMSEMMKEEAPADHIFLKTSMSVLPPAWMQRVAREWRILARGLPDTIHLHLYEDRMDLMRVAILGPKNTPYADAFFFFDLRLTPDYPLVPPAITFWARGKRINPNLYVSGKVCLSLLGTWTGSGSENWRPHQSNILQLLVSILGLVLVEDPYFNEPGFESSKGKLEGENSSRKYSEEVRLMVLNSMLLAPPIGFEELAKNHFESHGPSIVKRVERLAYGKPEGRAGRIDGIDLNKKAPSENFKKELEKVLPLLKDGLQTHESASSDVGASEVFAVQFPAKPSKLAWIGRLKILPGSIGGG